MALSDRQITLLIQAAQGVRAQAYCPYSKYAVGAALLAASGAVYMGCNVENAAFPAGVCAERVALVKAISEGEREFVALAVVTDNGEACCGICRQSLSEHAPRMPVILADAAGRHRRCSVDQLLPDSFVL